MAAGLSSRRIKALSNFMAILPTLEQHACLQPRIIESFKDVGMLGEGGSPWPVFETLVYGTCKRVITREERELVDDHMPELLDEQFEYGQVRDCTMEAMGLTCDTLPCGGDAGGRPWGARAEHMQRAKCLTHKSQQEMRIQVQREALSKKQARAEADQQKSLELTRLNVECEQAVLKLAVPATTPQPVFGPAYQPSSRDIAGALQTATVGHFSKMRSDRLAAFIFVRVNETVRGKKCMCKKGTEAQAEAGSPDTLIRRAWDVRCTMPVMRAPIRENDAAPTRARNAVSTSRPMLGYSAAQGKKASELLNDAAWVQAVHEELDCGVVAWQPAQADIQECADKLQVLLQRRLPATILARVQDPSLRKHTVWTWVNLCIPYVAAIACLSGHVHASYAMDTMLDDDCLLASDASCFVEASGVKSMLCGAYIIWDEIRRKPIRVGKACSDNGSFGARMTGHMEALKSSRCDSEFYTCYPRKEYVNPTYASKARGFFETLKQFIGVGFRKEKTRLLCTDTTHGGILEWPPFAVELSKKMSSATSEAKRAELTAYMFECVYGLMLAPRENMSQSMGFEPLLLVQNKRYLDNVA